jgi:hypothetical protein
MKRSKLLILSLILTLAFNTACIVRHDNGKHKGWFKGPKGSGNSNYKSNPGKGNKK